MNRAFSLVELSIVLVILGLLVGGVLAGQSLIRASELRSVSADFGRIATATNSFKDKYFQYPGDFDRATSFWPANGACPSTSTTTTTCNGNNNRVIEGEEGPRFFQHLARAGMLDGNFDGMLGMPPVTGLNVMQSRLSGGYFAFPYDISGAMLSISSSLSYTPITLGTRGNDNSSGDACYGCGGIIRHQEAWNVDTKMDDGIADKGAVRADLYTVGASATTGTCTAYALSNTTDRCVIGIRAFR